MKIPTESFLIFVPRQNGHAQVSLTILHDRQDFPSDVLLSASTKFLSSWKNLSDKAEVIISETDLLIFLLETEIRRGTFHV